MLTVECFQYRMISGMFSAGCNVGCFFHSFQSIVIVPFLSMLREENRTERRSFRACKLVSCFTVNLRDHKNFQQSCDSVHSEVTVFIRS